MLPDLKESGISFFDPSWKSGSIATPGNDVRRISSLQLRNSYFFPLASEDPVSVRRFSCLRAMHRAWNSWWLTGIHHAPCHLYFLPLNARAPIQFIYLAPTNSAKWQMKMKPHLFHWHFSCLFHHSCLTWIALVPADHSLPRVEVTETPAAFPK